LVFGPEWAEAGRFAQLMAVAYLAGFAVTPVSQTLFILERQVLQLAWDVTRLVLTAGGAIVCGAVDAPVGVAIAVLAGSNVVSYALLYVLCIRSADASDRGKINPPASS
jgi:O-antigen/teichoic acid export membrane protein